jgi:hypothetical protein
MPTPSSSDGPPEGVFASPIHPFLLIVSKPMRQSGALAADERIVDVMIQLARAAKTQRAIAAGDSSFELLVELHRRGFLRATTTRTCRIPCGQFDLALVACRRHPLKELEATLDRLAPFVSPTGVLVIWVGSHEPTPNRMLRLVLGRLGFHVESGTCHEGGVAIAARRFEACPIGQVA